jgi:DNA-binding NarL/FixJ family response regulator
MGAGEGRRASDAARLRVVESQRVGIFAVGELARRRIADALRRDGFDVVVNAAALADLLARHATRPADVLVVAIGDSPRFDAEALDAVRACPRDVPVVVVAPSVTRRTMLDALEAGATGLVTHDGLEQRLGATIRAVCVGQVAVPAEAREAIGPPLLTPREKQVLSMVVLGFTNGEIAGRLFVTETTVKSHLSSAYRKLGVRSRQEATAVILDSSNGLGLGILSLSPAPTVSAAKSFEAAR